METLKNKSIGPIVIALILFLFCVLTYYPILNHHFMIDDFEFVTPESIAAYFPNWQDFFTKPVSRHYHPLNYVFSYFLYNTFQTPQALYFINIILLFLNSFLHYYFINRLTQHWRLAFLTALIFIVHPMNAETIQHILYVNIIFITTLFIQLSLITIDIYLENKERKTYLFISLLLFILALFSYEFTMFFPLYLLSLLWFRSSKIKDIVKTLTPFICISVIHVITWLYFVGGNARLIENVSSQSLSIWSYIANLARIISWYMHHLFLPEGIVFIFSQSISLQNVLEWNLASIGALTGVIFLIFFYFKKHIASFALLIFLFGFLICVPASPSRPWLGMIIEPNWFYFSSIGIYLLMALLIFKLEKLIHPKMFIAIIISILLYFNLYTQKINFVSRDELSYCENWLKHSPGNVLPMVRLAKYYGHNDVFEIPPEFIPQFIDKIDVYTKLASKEEVDKFIQHLSSLPLDSNLKEKLESKLNK